MQTVPEVPGLCEFLLVFHQKLQSGSCPINPTHISFCAFCLVSCRWGGLHGPEKMLLLGFRPSSDRPCLLVCGRSRCIRYWCGHSGVPKSRRRQVTSLCILFLETVTCGVKLRCGKPGTACCKVGAWGEETLARGGGLTFDVVANRWHQRMRQRDSNGCLNFIVCCRTVKTMERKYKKKIKREGD